MTDDVSKALAGMSDDELLAAVNDALAQRRGEVPSLTPDVELELILRTTLDPNFGLPADAVTETRFSMPPPPEPPDPDAEPAADLAAFLAQILDPSNGETP